MGGTSSRPAPARVKLCSAGDPDRDAAAPPAARLPHARLPPRPRPPPPAGLVAGVTGGVTNSPAPALVLYFQGIGLAKHDFISSVAFAFFFYKLVQLGAVTWYGLLPWSLLWGSVALTVAALAGFAVGLRVQDRLDQRSFNRAVLVFLAVLGAWLLFRSLG